MLPCAIKAIPLFPLITPIKNETCCPTQNNTRAVLAECSVASAPFEFPDTLCLAPFVRHFRKNFVRVYHWSKFGISTESFLLFYRRTAPASADALQQNWMETFLSFLWNIPKHSFEQFLNGKLKRLKQLLRLIKNETCCPMQNRTRAVPFECFVVNVPCTVCSAF